jgi:endonuclease/exonuclease/phosphatase family metal-dependent hydrolase
MIILKRKQHTFEKKRNYTDLKEPRYTNFELCKTPSRSKGSFKIVSYNIKYSKRIEKASSLLRRHHDLKDADVICLQEMTLDAVEQIAEILGYNYVYYPAVFHPILRKDFGNAVLSRWPISFDEKIILPHWDPKHSQRIVVNVRIEFNEMPIFVSCVHFKVLLRATFRAEQTAKLLKSMPSSGKHFIIAGDFNTFTKANKRAILEPLVEADFIPATADLGWSHKHWTLLNKKVLLDHIFIKGFDIVRTGKVIDRKSSDHIPIWAELSFP